jgi:tRNA-2-methylthio-N6-dimethylallyladenosine synthase
MKYFIATYGCQANYADSERIARRLENMGHTKTNQIEKAGLVVINACSVRQSAMDRVYSKINRCKNKKIILAGCILPADKKKLFAKGGSASGGKNNIIEIWHPNEYFEDIPLHTDDSSAFVPIMTGCNNFCTYCAVPYTRGREKSRPAGEIIKEVTNLIKNGYKEIRLLGQNVNSYSGKFDFFSRAFIYKYINDPTANPIEKKSNFPLLLKIINDLPGDFKIRFLTSHPKDMSDELIKTIAECEKVSKEIHLPLQSGDNAILKKMNRKYTIGHYKNLIKKIYKQIPNAKISTDIIVGFPGETKKQFENTVKAMAIIGFSKAYIACYSPRPGTATAKLKDNIPRQEKKQRRKILVKILEEQNAKK